MNKHTNVKLQLLTDIRKLLFVERGEYSIKHGLVKLKLKQIIIHVGNENNYNNTGYDQNEPSKYIMYWDLNNVYGWAVMQYLPFG